MADANTIRQRRHDSCKAMARCPKCCAPAGRCCYGSVRQGNSHVYPAAAFRRQVAIAGQQMGKTMVTTQHLMGQMMRSDWGREMGGLHRERWAAWAGRSAVERLGELVDD